MLWLCLPFFITYRLSMIPIPMVLSYWMVTTVPSASHRNMDLKFYVIWWVSSWWFGYRAHKCLRFRNLSADLWICIWTYTCSTFQDTFWGNRVDVYSPQSTLLCILTIGNVCHRYTLTESCSVTWLCMHKDKLRRGVSNAKAPTQTC